jgi:hypothetical protein
MQKMHSHDCNAKQRDHLHAKSIEFISPSNRVVFLAPVVPDEVVLGVHAKWINSSIESACKTSCGKSRGRTADTPAFLR